MATCHCCGKDINKAVSIDGRLYRSICAKRITGEARKAKAWQEIVIVSRAPEIERMIVRLVDSGKKQIAYKNQVIENSGRFYI